MAQAHYDTYRDQLASLYHGHALWEPDPARLYDRVRVGDVGYVKRGHFFRMFNILLQANDTAQVYGVPEGFVQLNTGAFHNVCTLNLPQGDYCSNTVKVVRGDGHQADGPGEPTSATFRCRRNSQGGAFLSLPFHGVSEDAIRTKAFETYIRKHCDSWLEFTVINDLDIRLEDIILVTGCDLTSSWAMGAFTNPLDPEMTLHVKASKTAGSAVFQWSPTNQPRNNEPNQNTEKSHCIFLRGFRVKRILPFFKTLKAAAEPRPDNPDNEPESSIELLREPTLPDYRDPLMGILDYIAEQRPNDDIALAHEDDLKMIKGVDVLTADAVENFLRQNDIPVQTEEGLAFLADKASVSAFSPVPSMSSQSDRKRHDNLPPSRARDAQQTVQACRAAYINALEQSNAALKEENSMLRAALNLLPANRLPLGKSPTGKDKPKPPARPALALDTTSSEGSSADSPTSTRAQSLSPSTIATSIRPYPNAVHSLEGGSWDQSMMMGEEQNQQTPHSPSPSTGYPLSGVPAHTKAPSQYSYPGPAQSSSRTALPGTMYIPVAPQGTQNFGHTTDHSIIEAYGGNYPVRDLREYQQPFPYSHPSYSGPEPTHPPQHSPSTPSLHYSTQQHRDAPSAQTPIPFAHKRSISEPQGFSSLVNQYPHLPPPLRLRRLSPSPPAETSHSVRPSFNPGSS